MKIIHFIIIFFLTAHCFSQKWGTKEYIEKYNYKEIIGSFKTGGGKATPDKYAMYPNGKKGIIELIKNTIKIPKKPFQNGVSGVVEIRYTVGSDGYVKDIKVVKSVDMALDKAAIQVIKSMKRWIPGKKDGEYVPIQYQQPFAFYP